MPWQVRQTEGNRGYNSADMQRRKQRAVVEKAKLRRDYSKLLKKSGVQDVSASFERVKPCFALLNDGKCPHGDKCRFSHDPAVLARIKQKRKGGPQGAAGGRKRKLEADAAKLQEEREKEKVEKEKALKKAMRDRKKKTRMHMQRTRRGLPVLGNQIKLILEKLEKNKAAAATMNDEADSGGGGGGGSDSDSDEDAAPLGPATAPGNKRRRSAKNNNARQRDSRDAQEEESDSSEQ